MDLWLDSAVGLRIGAATLSFGLVLWLERLRPFRRSVREWGRERRHLALWGSSALLLQALPFATAIGAATSAEASGVGLLNQRALPTALHAVAGVIALDAWTWWVHRIYHRVPILWRFHRVHHTDRVLTASTGVRFHPGEVLVSALLRIPVVYALGISASGVIAFEVTLLAVSLVQHADVRLGDVWARRIERVFVTPNFHRSHHSTERAEAGANFGSLFSGWDALAGTLRRVAPERVEVGPPDESGQDTASLGDLLAMPFRALPCVGAATQICSLQLVIALVLATSVPDAATAEHLLWQTNAAGDDIHLIDPLRLEVIDRLMVGDNPHGIAVPADERTVFVTLERNGAATGELLWIDRERRQVTHRITVGPEPHQLAVTPDGRFAYVPCRDGHYWVVDTQSRSVITRINTGGRPHNTTASSDGRFIYLSPMGENAAVTVVDVNAGHRVIGQIPFANSVRPPALSDDGRLFQQVDALNGFQVANVRERRVIATVRHSTELGWVLLWPPKLGWLGSRGLRRCHGLAVRPDQAEIWSTCGEYLAIHDLAAPFPERTVVALPAKGYWLTFAPDSSRAFVALADSDEVAVYETERRTLLGRVPVGHGPKRNLVIRR